MPITNAENGHLTDWAEFNRYIPENQGLFDFTDIGDVNRFAARFRAANCFAGIVLEGYAKPTTEGYSALYQIMLTWSAFEAFLNITGTNQNQIANALEQHDTHGILDLIRSQDKNDKFYRSIYQNVKQRHKDELDRYFQGNPCNISYLASSIRHRFAHGWLSPNANEVSPTVVVRICHMLCEFLLTFMDQEFSQHVQRAKTMEKNFTQQ